MDKSKIERKLNGYIYIPAEGEREFFLIHGYTGSTHDFSNLPQILNESFDAGVNRILLPGHEKDVDALLDLTLNDFIDYTEKIFVERMMAGKKIILVGISFGAQLAMYLASKYEVAGIVIISMAHKFKWPLNIPGTALLAMTRKKWKKRLSVSENELRKDSCCYSYMPSAGFFMTKKFAKMIEGSAKNVNAPILSVYSTSERLANYKAIDNLYKKLSSIKKEKYLVSNEFHSLFYSPHKEEIIHKIISFVKDNSLFENVHSCQINADEKVTAIVPSYNEATRIGKVLEVLEQVNFIEEIIVVDDASSDDTESVVTRFKKS